VIPARNEAARLPGLLAQLASAPRLIREVVVVDGDSEDATARVARLAGARVLQARANRGQQLALGVAASSAPWLLLLHADGCLPAGWDKSLQRAMSRGDHLVWAFRLAIDGGHPALRLVELAVQLRSRWRQLPYGDQGLLLSRRRLEAAGGVRPLPLMEDLDLVQRLRQQGPIRMLPLALRVDGRRWRRLGVIRTTWINHQLRRAWRRGLSPETLAAVYRGSPGGSEGPSGGIPEGAAAIQGLQLPALGGIEDNHAGIGEQEDLGDAPTP
jgi:rSAM/selenodomain-associated transferase 2